MFPIPRQRSIPYSFWTIIHFLKERRTMSVTWEQIRSQFTDEDVAHMLQVTHNHLNLADCQSVKQNASEIFSRVSDGSMPPGKPWPAQWIKNFADWMVDGSPCPQEAAHASVGASSTAHRIVDVSAATTSGGPTEGASSRSTRTSNWFAWNNLMPPGPPSFHIVGEVQVPNPGVDVLMTERMPQGINPAIILLDLHLVQRAGIWPQHVVVKQAHFEKPGARYDEADVFLGTATIARVPVVDIF